MNTTNAEAPRPPDTQLNENLFLPVLKRVALLRDCNAQRITREDVWQALRHFHADAETIAPFLRWVRSEPAPTPANADELLALLSHDLVTERKIRLDEEIRLAVLRLAQCPQLTLRYGAIWRRWSHHSLYTRFYTAAVTAAGQEESARQLAMTLYTQLSDPQRKTTARVLLHGSIGSGTREMARSVLRVLTAEGYAALEIDCTAYRSEGEAASLTGSKSYWGGSKPGEVTGFIHHHRRAVVLFHDIDQTIPAVMTTLKGALQEGVLTDHFGLEEGPGGGRKDRDDTRPITPVDCSQAVFLFTASEAAEWHDHPDAAHILGGTDAMRKASILHALQSAQREHRGEQVFKFDAVVLNELANGLVLLPPPSWALLLDQTTAGLPEVLARASERLGRQIKTAYPAAVHELALVHLLAQGAHAGLMHTTAPSLYKTLFDDQEAFELHRAQDYSAEWRVGLTRRARAQLKALTETLGANPLRMLRRRQQFLEPHWKVSKQGLWIDDLRLTTARTLADYSGSVALLSAVPKTRLAEVAGHEAVKHFFREMIHYLRDPSLLRRLNVDMPKGCLLYGPPGTGKTLLAQAFAGEAQLPFLAISGAEFLDLAKLERLYALAKRNAPAVIYIDEADVLGHRGCSPVHDAVINKLLSEIQGFSSNAAIFHILSSNRPDEFDPALVRPGRIDRRFLIGALDEAGRVVLVEQLLTLLAPDVDTVESMRTRLLAASYGMTGAELAQVRREAALRACRQGVTTVAPTALMEELERIKYGIGERRITDPAERYRLAAHEAGHALVHHLLFGQQRPIDQLSIVPRGNASGILIVRDDEANQIAKTAATLRADMAVNLGGRASEMLHFSAEGPGGGAGQDLARSTEMAWRAVTQLGLDEVFGPLSLAGGVQPHLSPPPAVMNQAWERVRHWLDAAHGMAMDLLRRHRPSLDALREALLSTETLSGEEVAELIELTERQALSLPPQPVQQPFTPEVCS